MRLLSCAAIAGITLTLSVPALAQEDDDEDGWFEPDASDEPDEVEEVEEAAPPVKRKSRRKKPTVERADGADEGVPPAWTRGRRGRPKKVLPAEEGEPPPPGYRLAYKNRKNLWIPGVVLLSTGYAASALSSISMIMAEDIACWDSYCSEHSWAWGFLPVAGPFVIAADPDFEDGWRVAYGVFGVAQGLGLGLTIAGAATKRPVWVLKPEYRHAGDTQLTVTPGLVGVKTAF